MVFCSFFAGREESLFSFCSNTFDHIWITEGVTMHRNVLVSRRRNGSGENFNRPYTPSNISKSSVYDPNSTFFKDSFMRSRRKKRSCSRKSRTSRLFSRRKARFLRVFSWSLEISASIKSERKSSPMSSRFSSMYFRFKTPPTLYCSKSVIASRRPHFASLAISSNADSST